ncbi:MAG: VCBS repeat-containing protein [Gemmatimonadota bacterium]
MRGRCSGHAAAVAALLFLSGCGGGAPGAAVRPIPSGPLPGAEDAWVRVVDAFPVRDGLGELIAHPFLGGFDVPRPQLADLDGDGDLDLFVQERTDELMFFENIGSATTPQFAWRSDRFQDISVGEWTRFGDFDNDGDLDLLTELPYSYLRYYVNEGTATAPRFRMHADSLRDPAGEPIFSDRQNIPSLADIDCDGVLDLFLGRVDGTVRRYEQESDAPLSFRLMADRFEDISIVAQIGSRHGANSMAFADLDEDGDLDLIWGDFFEPGLLFIENTGTCQSPVLRSEPIPLPAQDTVSTSGYNVPVPVDLDADGDLDLLMGVLGGAFNPSRTAAANLYFYERTERGLTLRTRQYLTQIDVGSESTTALADDDGDGDLDLFVGNKLDASASDRSKLYRFENVGTSSRPSFQVSDTLDLGAHYHLIPTFADLDADGDLDLVVGTWRDGVQWYRNDGTRTEPDYVTPDTAIATLTRGSNATPALGDVDGDGDLDLMVGESSGELNYYRNEGTPAEPRFTLVSDRFGEIDVGRRSFPVLMDRDGDGDVDLLLGAEDGAVRLFENIGGERFVEDPDFKLQFTPFSTPTLGDLDGDGREELITGGLSGGVFLYRRR